MNSSMSLTTLIKTTLATALTASCCLALAESDGSQSRLVPAGMRSRPPKPSGVWRRFRKALGSRGAAIAWLTALVSGAAALGGPVGTSAGIPPTLAWVLGLLHHWQWAYLVVGLTAAITGFLCGRRLCVIPAAVILGIWSVHVQPLPQAPGSNEAASAASALRVASVNLNYQSADLRGLSLWLSATDLAALPDVLVLQEFTPQHERALANGGGDAAGAVGMWSSQYPHRSLLSQPDQFGLAVLSRWPISSSAQAEALAQEDTPKLRLVIDWNGQMVALSAVHPMPPISPAYAAARDRSLLTEAKRLERLQIPAILVGDFNDTPWSGGMRALEPHLSRASSLAPSWPNASGSFSVLPLDHILGSRHWQVITNAVGPDVGSDHRPVTAALTLAR